MFTALGAPQDFEIFDWFLYHFKSIATEQLFITIVFQANNKKFFHSTLVCAGKRLSWQWRLYMKCGPRQAIQFILS